MNSPFGNVQFVPGLGYVETTGPAVRRAQEVKTASALGDDSAVMMISGLGKLGNSASLPGGKQFTDPSMTPEQIRSVELYNAQLDARGAPMTMKFIDQHSSDIIIFGIKLPWWMWLLVGASAAYAGFLLMKKLKKS